MGKSYGPEVRARFLALIDEGSSVQAAAGVVGINTTTGYVWAREAGRGLRFPGSAVRHGPAVRERFWEVLAQGEIRAVACRAAGVSQEAGRRWFVEAGGVKALKPLAGPRIEARVTAGRGRLSYPDRCHIESLDRVGYSPAEIAGLLGRARSTITRELRRGRPETGPGRYRATVAHSRIQAQARRPKVRKLVAGTALYEQVRDRLRQRHSPEQISGALRSEYPEDPEMWVSHETIYQALYVQARGGLRAEVAAALRTGRARRKPQGRQLSSRGRIKGMVSISQRPAEAADRAVPGHWEGDLIIGANSASAIGTLVERTSGFLLLLHLPHDHTAATVAEAMTAAVPTIPEIMWRSLTWDQGSEMARHAEITQATGLPIYFADPHSPWQRGTNENTNGLLRQYFPKGTDLSVHGPGILANVAAEINGRPRKRHQWRTPAQVLHDLLESPPTSFDAVATTP